MANPRMSSFTGIDLSPEEENIARTFNHLQLYWLQNEKSKIAENIINLKMEGEDINLDKFKKDHAFLEGQLALVQYIIDSAITVDSSPPPSEQKGI
jgi:hypothetical protein